MHLQKQGFMPRLHGRNYPHWNAFGKAPIQAGGDEQFAFHYFGVLGHIGHFQQVRVACHTANNARCACFLTQHAKAKAGVVQQQHCGSMGGCAVNAANYATKGNNRSASNGPIGQSFINGNGVEYSLWAKAHGNNPRPGAVHFTQGIHLQ